MLVNTTPRIFFPKVYFDKLRPTFQNHLKLDDAQSLQPRLRVQSQYLNANTLVDAYKAVNVAYNPFTLLTKTETVTLKGMITELGAPIVGRRVMVVLMTSDGNVVEKTWTDLEGNFVFYEIPQNMSLMAVAVDATYKYNAVILSKILTVDNGE